MIIIMLFPVIPYNAATNYNLGELNHRYYKIPVKQILYTELANDEIKTICFFSSEI